MKPQNVASACILLAIPRLWQVAIWRLGLLEGLRRGVAWLALAMSYAAWQSYGGYYESCMTLSTLYLGNYGTVGY